MNLFYVILYHFTTHSNNSKKNLLINRKILNNENLNEIKNVNIIDILINVIVNEMIKPLLFSKVNFEMHASPSASASHYMRIGPNPEFASLH